MITPPLIPEHLPPACRSHDVCTESGSVWYQDTAVLYAQILV